MDTKDQSSNQKVKDRLPLLLCLILLFTLTTRIYALSKTHGMIHPDSLYQYLEPAHLKLFGYGVVPWEFADGIRSWFYPLIIFAVFKASALLRFDEILQMIFAVRILNAAISVALVYVTYMLGSIYNKRAGVIAAFFTATSGLLFLWTARIMPEIPSMFFFTLALYALYKGVTEENKRLTLVSGAILGLSFMLKFTSSVFLIPMAFFALVERKRLLGYFLLGFLVVLFFQGLLDVVTWGSFLHSPVAFLVINVIQGKSSIFGIAPFYFYVVPLAMHLPLLLPLPWAFEKKKYTLYLSGNFLFYLVVFSLIPHKEVRFLFTILPIFFVLCARGLDNLIELIVLATRKSPILKKVSLLLVLLFLMAQLLIFFELPKLWGEGWTPYYDNLQAVHYVGKQADSTGIGYTTHWYLSGIYTYLHKDIPAVHITNVSLEYLSDKYVVPGGGFRYASALDVIKDQEINYIVTSTEGLTEIEPPLNGFDSVKTFGNVTVYRRSWGEK